MVEAAAMFRKSGFDDSDSAALAKVAAMYQNVSDTAVSAEDAAASIVSQIRAFGEDASFATTIIDAYNEVANNFSTGTNDLSNAMEIAGAGLATYNNTFQETLGLVTAGTEIFVGRSSQVARGLSTIASNTAKAGEELAKYDIDVKNADGSMRSTYDILKDVAKIWKELDDSQRQALGETLSGGVNQYKVLAAIMTNFQTAIDATATAYDSAGSAAEENAKYMEHLDAQVNNLKRQFQDFANNVLDKDTVSAFLNVGGALLDFANTDIGTAVTRIGLLSGTTLGLLGIFGQLSINLLKMKKVFSDVSGIAGLFAPKSILIITGVVAGIAALVEIVRGIKGAYDAAHPSLEQVNADLETSQKQLEENADKLKELNNIPYADRSSDIALETEQLKLENKQLEKQIQLLDKQKQKAAQKEYESAKKVYTGQYAYTKRFDTAIPLNEQMNFTVMANDIEEAYQKIADASGLTVEQVKSDNGEMTVSWADMISTGSDATRQFTGIMQSYANAISNGIDPTGRLRAEYEQNKVAIDELYNAVQYLDEEYVAAHPEITSFINAYKSLNAVMGETGETADDAKDGMEGLGETLHGAQAASGETANKIKEVANNIIGVAAPVDTATQSFVDLVAEEIIFNSTGLNVADKLAALGQLAQQAGMTAGAIASIQGAMGAMHVGEDQIRGYMRTAQLKGSPVTRQQAENALLADLWKSMSTAPTTSLSSGGYGGGGGGSSVVTDAQLEALKEAVSYQKQLYQFSEASGQSIEQQAQRLKQVQAALHAQAQYMRSQLADGQSDTTEIVALSTEWWNIQNQINGLYEDTTEEIDAEKERLESIVDTLESELDVLEKRRKAIQSQMSDITDKKSEIEDIISYMSEYSSRQIDSIQAEIDAIDEAADAINEKYDAQIKALEKTNSELDKEIKRQQLLANLAKAQAKQVLVYKDGQFVYDKDISEISKAQSALNEFDRAQLVEKEKEAIEQNRKNELEYNNQEKAALEAEKKRWQEYKDGWDNLVKEYNYQQTELLLSQKYGINMEKSNWDDRLDNFDYFVDSYEDTMRRYIAIQEELADVEEEISRKQEEINNARDNLNNYEGDTGNSGSNKQDSLPRVLKVKSDGNAPSNARIGDYIVTGGGIFQITGGTPGNWTSDKITGKGFSDLNAAKEWLDEQGYVFQYAKGTRSAYGGLSMVGENGPELRVLGEGDGIIPADVTENLWQWGKFSPADIWSKLGEFAHNIISNGNEIYQFNIDNLNLPNAKDAQGLLNGLKRYAFQVAYERG
jgi:TP901 family phage tail tape measure protein